MSEVNRIGFTELASTESAGDQSLGNKRVNIILVHGLRGHPYNTWASSKKAGNAPAAGSSGWRQKFKSRLKPTTPPSESSSTRQHEVFWPQDYLAKDISKARVWTYGCNADVIGGLFQANNQSSVSVHGRDLEVRFEREIENKVIHPGPKGQNLRVDKNNNQDPVIFLAHSLGGIIVKDAIERSEACRQRTKLIVFLGTPHRGSPLAGWGEIASNLARVALQDSNNKIVETLEVENEVLDNIHERFVKVVLEYGIRIHSFQEGRGLSGIRGLEQKVVSDFSSRLGLPSKMEKTESIDANHMQMARCDDRSNQSYRCIAGVLKQLLETPNWDTGSPLSAVPQMQPEAALSAKNQGDAPCSTTTPYCIPFQNHRFIGRAKKLEELEEKLIISSHCQKLALVGLGGVGKTQVALQFAYNVKELRPEYSIFWAPAVSPESFEQAYRDIATRCSIKLDPKEEDPKESVRRYLNSDASGKWLLIVDNADDEEILFGKSSDSRSVMDYLPQSENGLTLFTTRHRVMAVSLARNEVVEVDEMDQEEAEMFLKYSLIQKELVHDRENTKELFKELEFLPLAIAQAAAYINQMRISIPEYLSFLRSTEQDTVSLLSREFHDDTRYKNSRNAVAATWLISFDQIRRSEPDAADLLSFMSCIEHKAIPRTILPSVEPAERMMRAMGTLRAYAFVTRRDGGDIYDMHRLVHLATKVWLDKHGDTEALNENVAAHLAEIFPSDDYANQAIWREYFPHALQFLRHTKTLDIEARYDLCFYVGKCLDTDGRVGEAVVWLSQCFLWRRGRYPEDHPFRLASQHELATACRADGRVGEAVELLEKIVAIEKNILVEDHPDRLASQHALAKAYGADGRVKEAIELLERIVAIEKNMLVADNSDRLASQHELAKAYGADGRVGEAIKLLEHVVAIREVLKDDHPDRLSAQHELARAYKANGQVKEAIEMLEHIVAIQEVLREHHPHRLISQHVLAVAYQRNGLVKEAIELLEHVVAIREKVLKKDHPRRLASQHELAVAYQADGRVQDAITLLEHVVATQKRVLREDHPDRVASQSWLLFLQAKQNSERENQTETSRHSSEEGETSSSHGEEGSQSSCEDYGDQREGL